MDINCVEQFKLTDLYLTFYSPASLHKVSENNEVRLKYFKYFKSQTMTSVPAIRVQTVEHALTELTATIAPVLSDSTDPTVKQVRVVKKQIENGVPRSFRTKQIFVLLQHN